MVVPSKRPLLLAFKNNQDMEQAADTFLPSSKTRNELLIPVVDTVCHTLRGVACTLDAIDNYTGSLAD